MSEKTCGTCKHLGEPIERLDDDYEPLEPIYHACSLIKLRGMGDKSEPIAYTQDASLYVATLCVKDEFGCNQWSAK